MVYSKGTLEDKKCSRHSASFGGVMSDVVVDVPFPMAVSSRLLDDFGFSEIVDSMLDWDPKQCKISPGDAFKSIVMNTASIKERPAVMNIGLGYQDLPLNLLFDTVQHWTDLDRFTISDHLDRLFEAGVGRVYQRISAAVRAHYEIVSRAVHSDTTSVNVWGTYDADYQNDGGIDITKGYSKDRRPDLNQYMVGNVVDDNGISLYSQPLDGNTSDVAWNRMCLDSMEELLKREDMIYVADSKVVTSDLVKRLDEAGIRFVSRLPKNYGDGLQNRVLAATEVSDLEPMIKLPSESKRADREYAERFMECDGIGLRLIPQVTSHNKGKGDRAVEKERSDFAAFVATFKDTYDCRRDAERALNGFLKKASKKHSMFRIVPTITEAMFESRGRGRPRRDGTDVRREKLFIVHLDNEEVPEERLALWKSAEFIVTVSNIPPREKDPERGMDADDVIRLYSNQWKAEGQFATLKRPAIADRLFLEKESRAEALVCIFNIGVLLRGLMQLLLRRGLERIPDAELPGYGVDRGPLQRNVTHAYFIQQFQNVNIHYYPRAREYVYSSKSTSVRANYFLGLMGIQPERLFENS